MRSSLLAILLLLVAAPENLDLRIILVKTEAQARNLRARIQKGESFEELARKYSMDASAAAGGYLGSLAFADLRKEFRDGIAGLRAGDVSPVLSINGGYALLQLLGEQEALSKEGAHLNDLAASYRDQNNYYAAEPLYQRALAIAEKAFGPEHPNVGAVVINLASLYHDERKYDDAERLYRRALAIYEKAYGPDDSRIAQRVVELAELYLDRGNSAAAEPLYKRAAAIVEKNQGPDHPDLAASLLNLALLYENQGNTAAAEPLNKRARAIYEKAAAMMRKNGQKKEAEEMELRARAIQVTQ